MINFRYHIVSLMAVFLALSVGIVLGVTLRGPVDEGLTQQAEQDRRQVQELRVELSRRDALDDYREAYSLRSGQALTQGLLAQRTVALVTMPGAPNGVVNAITAAVQEAGGVLTHTVKVNEDVFDPARSAAVAKVLAPYAAQLELTEPMGNGARLGYAIGRAELSGEAGEQDGLGAEIGAAITKGGLVSIDGRSTDVAELAIVVTSEATDPRPTAETLESRVQLATALHARAAGVVVAGPNSDNIEGTDVLTARTDPAAVDVLSTVDVADLASGVTTTVMAGKEQLLGRQGHYGALARADSPLPQLPVR